MRVGVIGIGVVGGAQLKALEASHIAAIGYDKFKPEFSSRTNLNLVTGSDVVFICVPTPTLSSGEQDYEPLDDVLNMLARENFQGVAVIKSTVVPGTTQRLAEKHHLFERVVHNPEFLTAAKPFEDFLAQPAILLGGGDKDSRLAVRRVYEMLGFAYILDFERAESTEFAKYAHNVFLAAKVAFFNEFYGWVRARGIDYDEVIKAASLMGGIGTGHLKVPGPDGGRGFSGMCFVKDTEAILHWAWVHQLNAEILQTITEENRRRRPTAYDGTEATGYKD